LLQAKNPILPPILTVWKTELNFWSLAEQTFCSRAAAEDRNQNPNSIVLDARMAGSEVTLF
jgi:hypothetical protein